MTLQFGWAGPDEAARAWDVLASTFSPFAIAAKSKSTAGTRVVLWDYSRKVTGGRHLPTILQKIGSCVGEGAKNAVDYLACMEIARQGDREMFRPAFSPYIYGTSRVQIGGGRLGNDDGSLGVWAADAVRQWGVLAADEPGVPEYSGAVAKAWGKSGPPQQFHAIAKPHCLQSTAPVRSYEDVRDALANGYPVTIASLRGFRMRAVVDRGKHWGMPEGKWAHQMCIIGVDDNPQRPGAYLINSWGDDAHGPPADDAPPGGFWADASVIDQMVRTGEGFAYSQFNGFPEQLDFRLL